MTERQRLVEQLLLHEGIRLRPYADTVGKLTIGVGRNLTDKGISRREALDLLDNDLDECLRDLATFPWFLGLDPIRQRVLTDMRFNLGPRGFRGFTRTLASVAAQDFHGAANGMRHSAWAIQVKTRADRLAQMMETGQDYQ